MGNIIYASKLMQLLKSFLFVALERGRFLAWGKLLMNSVGPNKGKGKKLRSLKWVPCSFP